MTRINLVDPSELTDQHLIAEYRESRLLVANMRRIFALSGPDKKKIPASFTLNKGHVLFFKDKGMYIHKRYQQLIGEMLNRGFEPQFLTLDTSVWPSGFFNDWTPTERDKDIVRERIALRISQRPGWYRQRGQLLEAA
jgi:deoxyribonuclease (pyrimidine dimer)